MNENERLEKLEEFRKEVRGKYPFMFGSFGNIGSHRIIPGGRKKPSEEVTKLLGHHRTILEKMAHQPLHEKGSDRTPPIPDERAKCSLGVRRQALKKSRRFKVEQYLEFLKSCPDFKPDWDRLLIIRWAGRPWWEVNGNIYRTQGKDPLTAEQLEFNNICDRWFLSGIQSDESEPLVEEPVFTVDATGTQLRLPGFLSVDLARDIDWAEFNRLHRTHGNRRQGKKLREIRVAMRRQALLALEAIQEAKKMGLRGEKRLTHIKVKTGLCDGTDAARIRCLIRRGRALAAASHRE